MSNGHILVSFKQKKLIQTRSVFKNYKNLRRLF